MSHDHAQKLRQHSSEHCRNAEPAPFHDIYALRLQNTDMKAQRVVDQMQTAVVRNPIQLLGKIDVGQCVAVIDTSVCMV